MQCAILVGLLALAPTAQPPPTQLAAHPVLKSIEWKRDEAFAPLVILVQPPLPADKVAAFHGPALVELERTFRETLAEPAGLNLRSPRPVICVFAGDREWRRYADHEGLPLTPLRYGTHDTELGVSLACEGARGADADERHRPVLRAYAEALLAAHYAGAGGDMPRELWVQVGLPWHLSHPTPDPDHLATLVEAVERADLRAIYVPSLAELADAASFADDVWPGVQTRAEQSGAGEPLEGYAARVFHELLPLWMHFLLEGEDGRHREAFLRYFEAAMQGGGRTRALDAAFPGASLEDVERAFLNWVFVRFREARLGGARGARSIEQLFDERAALAEANAGSTAAATPVLERLLPDARDVSTAHALALETAARGEYAEAIAAIEALWERARGGPHDERLARELERMKGFARLREAFLVESVAKGRRLPIYVEGRKRTFKVLAVKGGVVELEDRKKELPEVRVEDLNPHMLAKEMSKLGENYRPSDVPEWMRLYAYVLAGDKTWTKLLKDRSDAAQAFEDDRDSYEVLVPTGAAARDLERIAGRTLPLSEADAQATEDDLRALLKTHGQLLLVRERMEHLRELARAAEERLFEVRGLRALFHGECKESGDGRVQLLYDFDRAQDLEDFTADPGYLAEFRGTLPGLLKEPGEPADVKVEEGAWHVLGATSYRHRLAFVAPVTVRYKLKYGYVTPGGTPDIHDFVAVCDNGAESYAALTGLGSLVVVDKPGYHRFEHVRSDGPFTSHKVFEMELEHDGRVVSTRVNGDPVREVPCGPRTQGKTLLFFHSDTPVAIEELAIEGVVDPRARAALRDAWTAERLSEIGFGD